MSAKIIQFPRKTPLEEHELPKEWSDAVKVNYVHMTYDGLYSHEDAFRSCQIAHEERRRDGEKYDDYVLRLAQSALTRALKKKQS